MSDVNSKLLIGGKARQYFEQDNLDFITPFWGFDNDGNLIQSKKIETSADIEGCFVCDGKPCPGDCWRVLLDFRKINMTLGKPVTLGIQENAFGQSGFGWVLENELRMALGDFETFKNKIINDTHLDATTGTDTVLKRYLKETLRLQSTKTKKQEPIGARAAVQTSKVGSKITTANIEGTEPQDGAIAVQTTERDKQTLFNWLNSYASENYGRKFLSMVPGVCVIDSTITDPTLPVTSPVNLTTIYTDEPSTEGGWPSLADGTNPLIDTTGILGLRNYTRRSDIFKDDTGKVAPIVKYDGQGYLSVENLNIDDYVTSSGVEGSGLWLKGSIDPQWVTGSPLYGDSPYNSITYGGGLKISALITVPATVSSGKPVAIAETNANSKPTEEAGGKLGDDLSGTQVEGVNQHMANHQTTAGSVGPAFMPPIAIGVPLKSNTRTYGPWYVVGANPGSVACEIDDGLVPWEYGGLAFMNAAGIAKVQNASTQMQFGDRGEVSIPGYPDIALGSPLSAIASLLFSARTLQAKQHVWARGVSTYGEINWAAPALPAGGGASVTNINVSVGVDGVTTSYSISTFTPVFGRFSKSNADRIKQIGLNKLAAESERRADAWVKRALKLSESKRIASNAAVNKLGRDPIAPGSPNIWFAGKLTEDGRRKIVISPDAKDLVYNTDYDNHAIMTMDGFFRPVSITGGVTDAWVAAGSGMKLPRINQQSASKPDTYAASGYIQTTAPPPPINEYTGLPIRQKYLDFLGDPYNNKGLFDDHRSTLAHGSDFVHASFDGLNPSGGHDIEGVARRSLSDLEVYSPTQNDTILFHDGDSLPTGGSGYASDYRFLAHRGPLVIHGWGYDVYGKPIPNAVGDAGASTGNFSNTYAGLSDRFKDNWLGDARNWPVAPVDLRFDRKRGVWTIPPAFRIYQVQNNESNSIAAGNSGPMSILKSKDDISDAAGDAVTNPTITIQNWTDDSIDAGAKTLAYYDSTSAEYWPIASAPSKVIAGVSKGGTAAKWNPDNMVLESGCIEVWTFSKPIIFDEVSSYPSGSVISISFSGYNVGTTYPANAYISYTGVSGCPASVWKQTRGASLTAANFKTEKEDGYWTQQDGCIQGTQYINRGEGEAANNNKTIGPGSFNVSSGWVSMAAGKVLNTGCTTWWSHGMTTAPVQGHYVQGGGGNDILVWYDCNALPGWVTIST